MPRLHLYGRAATIRPPAWAAPGGAVRTLGITGGCGVPDPPAFYYRPGCSVAGCERPATFRGAAPWSNGTSRELKNYGLTCDDHRDDQLRRAGDRRRALAPAEGETIGMVGLYRLRTLAGAPAEGPAGDGD